MSRFRNFQQLTLSNFYKIWYHSEISKLVLSSFDVPQFWNCIHPADLSFKIKLCRPFFIPWLIKLCRYTFIVQRLTLRQFLITSQASIYPLALCLSFQTKTAFLLSVAAFLRPLDLARISLLSVTVDEELKLRFNIVVPKERRNGRRIIKPVLIHSHNAHNLCPVVSFLALKDHPKATVSRPPGTLFVNALDCTLRVTNQTVASWLRRVIRRPTSKQRVSVRSFASSIALQRGLPVDDIQTLGNWATSTTFHNHYRREHLSIVDFTNSVFCWIAGDLPLAHKQENGISSDDEVFFGAEDTIQND